MKLATFDHANRRRIGLVDASAERVLDLQACHVAHEKRERACLNSMLALIDEGPGGLDVVRRLDAPSNMQDPAFSLPLRDVKLRAPLTEPRQLRDFSVYEKHLRDAPVVLQRLTARLANLPAPPEKEPRQVAKAYLDQPLFYFSNRFNIAGADDVVNWPRDSKYLDFELELAVCIGRTARDVTRSNARECIFGYTIFNDVSARDIQTVQMPGGLGPCKAKSYDGCNILGPWIVTKDELVNPYDCAAQVRVNGEVWARSNTSGMLHDFEDMIAFATRDETVHAGEVFGSGTIGGCCGLELDRWIKPGDVVELEIKGIGVLRNRFVAREL